MEVDRLAKKGNESDLGIVSIAFVVIRTDSIVRTSLDVIVVFIVKGPSPRQLETFPLLYKAEAMSDHSHPLSSVIV